MKLVKGGQALYRLMRSADLLASILCVAMLRLNRKMFQFVSIIHSNKNRIRRSNRSFFFGKPVLIDLWQKGVLTISFLFLFIFTSLCVSVHMAERDSQTWAESVLYNVCGNMFFLEPNHHLHWNRKAISPAPAHLFQTASSGSFFS